MTLGTLAQQMATNAYIGRQHMKLNAIAFCGEAVTRKSDYNMYSTITLYVSILSPYSIWTFHATC